MIEEQQQDPTLKTLFQRAVTKEEAKSESTCLYLDHNLLMRKLRKVDAPADYEACHQVIIPAKY